MQLLSREYSFECRTLTRMLSLETDEDTKEDEAAGPPLITTGSTDDVAEPLDLCRAIFLSNKDSLSSDDYARSSSFMNEVWR